MRSFSYAASRSALFAVCSITEPGNNLIHGVVNELFSKCSQNMPVATWAWDKATIIAGALLASSSTLPVLPAAEASTRESPFWVALDKHTLEGKAALHSVGKALGHPYRALIWAGFYCESAQVNTLCPSPWFETERSWKLRKTGLTFGAAMELWESVRPQHKAVLEDQAARLRMRLALGDRRTQSGLFG